MGFRIKYHCGETQVGTAQDADTLDNAHALIAAKSREIDCKADLAMIFRISPSGVEELEESRNLHVSIAPRP